MKKTVLALLGLFLCLDVLADGVTMLAKPDGTAYGTLNNGLPVSLSGTLSGEDQTNSVFKVEGQFSYSTPKTADFQVKASPGFVHTVTCVGTDAAATAGTIILYDSLTETGNIIWQFDVTAVALNTPFSVILDNVATTGLYLGYTTTADVRCNVSYR